MPKNSMHHPVVATLVDRHTGFLQLSRVGLALVAQGVVSGGDDDRGRDATYVAVPQGRDPRVGRIGVAPHVTREEPTHRLLREQVPVAVLAIRNRREVAVADGIDEHLQREVRRAASRAANAHTAARLPPALSPITASRDGSPRNVDAFFATQFNASQQSSRPAGKGCSGASR